MATDDFDQNFTDDFADAQGELVRIDQLADKVGRKLTTVLKGAILHSKSLNTILSDIGLALSDIALSAALKPVGNAFSGLLTNLFTSTNPVPGVKAFAKGGVVATPSFFPMGGGQTGLMGEAGAEAILPLSRGPDGRLGVRNNSGGTAPIQISMVISTPNADSFVRSQGQVNAMLARAVGRGRRAL